MSDFHIGVYGRALSTSRDDALDRLLTWLQRLKDVHPRFSQWYCTASSPAESLARKVIGEHGEQKRHILAQYVRDTKFSVHYGLWNGLENEDQAGVSCNCNFGPPISGIGDAVLLRFPLLKGSWLPYAQARAILQTMVEVWDPEWGVATTGQLRMSLTTLPEIPVVGWLTYLGGSQQIVGVPSVTVESQFGSRGTLVWASHVDECLGEEGAIAALRQITRSLIADGVLNLRSRGPDWL